MKRLRMIGSIIVVLGLIMVGLATPVLAHNPDDGEATTSSGVYLDQPTLIRMAQALGLTQDELLTRLQEGETISGIAADQNIPEEEVVEAIIDPYRDELQLRVKYSYITQEQADALLEDARGHARALLDQDLSNTREYGSDTWEEMEEYCGSMMGNGRGGMMGDGWSNMMGRDWGNSNSIGRVWNGMMGSGWDGQQNNGWGSRIIRSLSGMMSGWGGNSGGSRSGWGGMGGHMGGGMMGSGWGGMM